MIDWNINVYIGLFVDMGEWFKIVWKDVNVGCFVMCDYVMFLLLESFMVVMLFCCFDFMCYFCCEGVMLVCKLVQGVVCDYKSVYCEVVLLIVVGLIEWCVMDEVVVVWDWVVMELDLVVQG